MKVKRYLVDDLPEAVQLIRSELGSDAVILNTKEIRTGGFLGMFRKKRVEVIAAIDEATAAKPSPRPAARPPARPAERPPAVSNSPREQQRDRHEMLPLDAVRQRYGGTPNGLAAPSQPREAAAAPSARRAPYPAASPADREFVAEPAASRSGRMEDPLIVDQPSRAASIARAEAAIAGRSETAGFEWRRSPDDREEVTVPSVRSQAQQAPVQAFSGAREGESETAVLLAELRTMKDLMQKANREQALRSLPESILQLGSRLAVQGVEASYVEEFTDILAAKVNEAPPLDGETEQERIHALAGEILREWLAPSKDNGISPNTRIVHFVGPTGVGKTTTIAKLAADQAFGHQRSVGFITADTYRIAAVDQLRTYADILNMPLEVVFSPSELTRAYKKLEDRDLLLMDTAGRNYRNELFVSEVNSLLAPGQEAEKILVLSLTHKFSDMRQVSAHFVKYGVSRLLLTKMDETDSYGAILNLVREFGFRIPYVTFGQMVPDDIKPFDAEALITKLLEEPVYA